MITAVQAVLAPVNRSDSAPRRQSPTASLGRNREARGNSWGLRRKLKKREGMSLDKYLYDFLGEMRTSSVEECADCRYCLISRMTGRGSQIRCDLGEHTDVIEENTHHFHCSFSGGRGSYNCR